jgi:hypothetical protein
MLELGLLFTWGNDSITNRDFTDQGPEYYLHVCYLRNRDGEVVGSISAIDLGPHGLNKDPYGVVVEAELALEYQAWIS